MSTPVDREFLSKTLDRAKGVMRNIDIFPLNIFGRAVPHAFFDYGYITSEELFFFLKELCMKTNETGFTFAVMTPEPHSYYEKTLHWSPFLRFLRSDGLERWVQFVTHAPDGSMAEAIIYRADEVTILSDSLSFTVYGHRELDLALIGFDSEIYTKETINSFYDKYKFLMGNNDAYDHLCRLSYLSREDEAFISSWQD